MDAEKLLTLAVPTYNMEKYLARCLESCLCSHKDLLEILVINDGSKDQSSIIAHQYESQYPNIIHVIDKENGNYGTCVNRALTEAQGKYFRMLDADDWANTEALDQLLEYMQQVDADLFVTEADDCFENHKKRITFPDTIEIGKVYDARRFDGIQTGFRNFFCSHLLTYRTSLLKQIGLKLQAGISYTDNEYVYFPLAAIQTMVFFRLPVYQYFIGREGQTTDPRVIMKSGTQLYQVWKRLIDDYKAGCRALPEAVLNNQRILLAEVATWVFKPAFYAGPQPGQKQLLQSFVAELRNEPELKQLIHTYLLEAGVPARFWNQSFWFVYLSFKKRIDQLRVKLGYYRKHLFRF